MSRNFSIAVFLIFLSCAAFGQRSKVLKALRFYQAGNLDSAKMFIDSASVHPETSKDATTWHYKGFIYKDLSKKSETDSKKNAPLREEALKSFFLSMELDTTGEGLFRKSSVDVINNLAIYYYNTAATSLNEVDYPIAIANFTRYKEIIKKIEPGKNLMDIEVQLNNALGSIYMGIYDSDRQKNKEFFDKSKNAYLFVIELDSNNYSANYNLGILYYNEAVNIIKGLDTDIDLITLELIQEETVELFKKALPYMLKARDLNPKRKETLIGLSGIYFSLNELEKSEEIENEMKLLDTKD